jgi:hypothetical protein
MKICPVGVVFFQADGQTDGHTQTEIKKLLILFTILRKRLKGKSTKWPITAQFQITLYVITFIASKITIEAQAHNDTIRLWFFNRM